ncbi:MAG: Nif11-like leader peptide family natural product precursor [Leptolyngbya sp.]|nr:MAG: Nif11-like leader peptide family natural product precursor [Leptolyngbya sp.]
METNVFEKVKDFLVRLVKDSSFASQVQVSSTDQLQELLQKFGYTFSQADFETATIQILELKERDEFHELTEAELVGAVGGWTRRFQRWTPKEPIVQPLYGVVIDPPENHFPKPRPRLRPNPLPGPTPPPLYGVIIDPPIVVQPLYGVIIDPEIG